MNISMPLTAENIAGVAATLIHASRDKVTPVITGVQVTRSHVIATDRYSVGRYRHTEPVAPTFDENGDAVPLPATNDDAVTLTREAAEWIAKYKVDRYSPDLTLTLTIDAVADTLTVTDDAGNVRATLANVTMQGNYPPVARLFPESTEERADIVPFHLGADKLAAVAKTGQIIGRVDKTKNMPIRFQLAAAESAYKVGPVLFSVGDRFDGLLQPSMTTR